MDFNLSCKNFTDLPFDKYKNDFIFNVNGTEYQTNRVIADILSPYLRKLHYSDESIDMISVNTKGIENDKNDYFKDFLNLPITQNKTIDLQHQIYYSEFFYLLGNYEECINMQKNNLETVNVKNAVNALFYIMHIMDRIPSEFYYDSDPLKKLIAFISFHFDEIDQELLKKLPIEIIKAIVSNDSLKIDNESYLLKFIIELYKEDYRNAFLFEYVWFQFVDETTLMIFFDEFNSDDMNRVLWQNLQKILLKSQRKYCKSNNNKKEHNNKLYRYINLSDTNELETNNNESDHEIQDINLSGYDDEQDYDLSNDDNDQYLMTIIELVKSQFLNSNNNLSRTYITKITCILYSIAAKMAIFWENKVAHNILTTENIYVKNGYDSNLNMILNQNKNEYIENEILFNIFWAPEMIDYFEMTEMSDVYSFGIICFYLFTGKFPFNRTNTRFLVNMIRNHKRDDIPMTVPTLIRDLIQSCWNGNPTERPSFNEIIEILRNHANEIEGLNIVLFEEKIRFFDVDNQV